MRILGLLVLGVVLLQSGIADACGTWAMNDVETKTSIVYYISWGNFYRGKKVVARQKLDDENPTGLRTLANKKVHFDIKDGKLTRLGKTVATIDADGNIAFGKRVYTVE